MSEETRINMTITEFRIRAIGMFLAGIWFAQFLRWAIGGFHV